MAPSTKLEVPDRMQVGDHDFSDHDPHPTEDWSVTRILSESSNIGTIKLGQMLGKERLDEYLRRFGLGSRTALDFPNESPGILLDPNRLQRHLDGLDPDRSGDLRDGAADARGVQRDRQRRLYVPPKLVLETVDAAGARSPVDVGEPRRVVSERHGQPDARHDGQRGGRGHRHAWRDHRLHRGRQDGHRPQAPGDRRLHQRGGRLPLRGHLRRASCPPSGPSCRSSWSSTSRWATSSAARSPPRSSPTWRSTGCGSSASRRRWWSERPRPTPPPPRSRPSRPPSPGGSGPTPADDHHRAQPHRAVSRAARRPPRRRRRADLACSNRPAPAAVEVTSRRPRLPLRDAGRAVLLRARVPHRRSRSRRRWRSSAARPPWSWSARSAPACPRCGCRRSVRPWGRSPPRSGATRPATSLSSA